MIKNFFTNSNQNLFSSSNSSLKKTNYNELKLNNTKVNLPIKSSSCSNLFSNYSKDKRDYENLYTGKKIGKSSSSLEKTYLKNQNFLKNYYQQNKDSVGLKLGYDKYYEHLSIDKYINEIDKYKENIKNKLKKNCFYYVYPEEESLKLKNKMKLTPLPSKSRLLMTSDKEKNEFNTAERTAVMMRRVEYTHGLISKESKKVLEDRLNKERKEIYLIMKNAIDKISIWWKGILEKKKMEKIENEDYHEKYKGYLKQINNKKIILFYNKFVKFYDKRMNLLKKKLFKLFIYQLKIKGKSKNNSININNENDNNLNEIYLLKNNLKNNNMNYINFNEQKYDDRERNRNYFSNDNLNDSNKNLKKNNDYFYEEEPNINYLNVIPVSNRAINSYKNLLNNNEKLENSDNIKNNISISLHNSLLKSNILERNKNDENNKNNLYKLNKNDDKTLFRKGTPNYDRRNKSTNYYDYNKNKIISPKADSDKNNYYNSNYANSNCDNNKMKNKIISLKKSNIHFKKDDSLNNKCLKNNYNKEKNFFSTKIEDDYIKNKYMNKNNVNLMNKDIQEQINKFDKLRSIKRNNSKNHFKNSPYIENSKKNEEINKNSNYIDNENKNLNENQNYIKDNDIKYKNDLNYDKKKINELNDNKLNINKLNEDNEVKLNNKFNSNINYMNNQFINNNVINENKDNNKNSNFINNNYNSIINKNQGQENKIINIQNAIKNQNNILNSSKNQMNIKSENEIIKEKQINSSETIIDNIKVTAQETSNINSNSPKKDINNFNIESRANNLSYSAEKEKIIESQKFWVKYYNSPNKIINKSQTPNNNKLKYKKYNQMINENDFKNNKNNIILEEKNEYINDDNAHFNIKQNNEYNINNDETLKEELLINETPRKLDILELTRKKLNYNDTYNNDKNNYKINKIIIDLSKNNNDDMTIKETYNNYYDEQSNFNDKEYKNFNNNFDSNNQLNNIIQNNINYNNLKNEKRNKKLNQLKISSTSISIINKKKIILNEEKLKKLILSIVNRFKSEFFSRMILNYLSKSKVNLNNEELIELLNLGKKNTYQRILNNSLALNLIKSNYNNQKIPFKDWVKKFTKKTRNSTEENNISNDKKLKYNKNNNEKTYKKKTINDLIFQKVINNDNDNNENLKIIKSEKNLISKNNFLRSHRKKFMNNQEEGNDFSDIGPEVNRIFGKKNEHQNQILIKDINIESNHFY